MADVGSLYIQGFEQGAGLVARAKQLRLQEKEQESRQALLALQAKRFEMESEVTGLKYVQELQDMQFKLRQERGMTQIAALLSTMDPSDPATDKAIWAAVKENPTVQFHERFQGTLTYLNAAKTAKRMEETAASQKAYREKLGERAEVQIDISKENLEARRQEIELRRRDLEGRLDPLSRAELQAKLRAVTDDLLTPAAEKEAKVEAIINEFRTKAPGVRTYIPGQGWKPAP